MKNLTLSVLTLVLGVIVFIFALFCAGVSHALIANIDFEGVATPNMQTHHYDPALPIAGFIPVIPELRSHIQSFDGFDVTISHGHIEGRPFKQPPRPDSGSDWFLFDHGANGINNLHFSTNIPWTITRSDNLPFAISGFRTSEWSNVFTTGTMLNVVGEYHGGGSISTNFFTDNVFGFEQMNFPSIGWSNLRRVSFLDPISDFRTGKLGFDDIQMNVVPETETGIMVLLGVLLLILSRKRIVIWRDKGCK